MAKPKSSPVNPIRKEAWRLLDGVVIGQTVLPDLLSMPQHQALEPAQRAEALRLATATLRFADRADWGLKPFMARLPHDTIRNLLRLGVVEVCGEGAASHGVVNDLVALAGRSNRTAGHKGMVNAVLRRTIEKLEGNWDKAPIPKTQKWLRKPLAAAYGNSVLQGIERAHSQGPALDLTVKSDAAGWAEKLNGTVLPSGTVRLPSGGRVTGLSGFDEGAWWVQDAASSMPLASLDIAPGYKVLDLCAAPGGKAMQMAAAGAEVTAVDVSDTRLVRVSENLERVGLKAEIVTSDALQFQGGPYDIVVLDAPCSATGTIRRHPDLPFARDGAEIGFLIEQQGHFLDHAAKLVAPGGTLVFCTCSLLPDEGEVQVEDFLAKHKEFTAQDPHGDWIDPDWKTQEGGIRLRPDFWSEMGGMDGFYFAHLKRHAA